MISNAIKFILKNKFVVNKDKLLAILIVAIYVVTFFRGVGQASYFFIPGILVTIPIVLRFLILIFGCFFAIKKIRYTWLFLLGFYFVFVGVSSLILPDIEYLMQTTGKFIPIMLTTVILVSGNNAKLIQEYFYKVSYFIYLFLLFYFLYLIASGNVAYFGRDGYYMIFSYNLLPFVCISWNNFIKSRKLYDILLILFAFMIIVVWGCRGALVSALAYFLLTICRYSVIKNKCILLFSCILICTSILSIGYVYINEINYFFNSKLNVNTHFLRKIIEADNMNSITSGRNIMYDRVLNDFEKNPLIFRGINADFFVNGIYSHNIFIELIYDFGGILGIPIIICILFAVFYTLLLPSDNDNNTLIIFFFGISFFRLLVSNSLFYDYSFWCWLVILLKITGFKRIMSKYPEKEIAFAC